MTDRKPPPPWELVGALHDTVHINKGKLKMSKPIKPEKPWHLAKPLPDSMTQFEPYYIVPEKQGEALLRQVERYREALEIIKNGAHAPDAIKAIREIAAKALENDRM